MLRSSALRLAAFAWLVVLLAPLALGPALSPLVAALGGTPEHHCMCGMKLGACHCPECAAHEHDQKRTSHLPTVRATCETDATVPATFAPATCLPTFHVEAQRATSIDSFVAFEDTDPIVHAADRPPTPPPRVAG